MSMRKTRAEVTDELIGLILKNTDKEQRELLINNNWGLTAEEAEQSDYPPGLKKELTEEYFPVHDVMSGSYEPLLRSIIAAELDEKSNAELAGLYSSYTDKTAELFDADNVSDEELCPCPCCGNRTLPERGQYFICPVCDWEDDGPDCDHFSYCNGMTLGKAQENFRSKGSIY
jgi:hypothetical protein